MSYFTDLHTLNNIFGILLVALIITIFEICFFYIIMVPRIRGIVNNNINNISNKFKNTNLSINIIIDNILTKIFIDNEQLLNKINYKTIKNELKNEIKNEIMNEINKNKIYFKNMILDNKNKIEIENEINNNKNKIKNKINNKINEINENENENENETIENFDVTNLKNQRKFKPLFDITVADEISTIIIKVLKNNNIEISDKYKDYIKKLVITDFDSKILFLFNTLKYDENHIIDNNNNNTFIISIFVIIIILLLLKIFYNNISLLNINTGGGVENKVYVTSFIIIIIIILFLINFYFFGIAHKYKDNDEIQNFIFDNINL